MSACGWKTIYERVARQAPLDDTLRSIAGMVEGAWRGARVVVYLLEEGRLKGYQPALRQGGFLRRLDGFGAGEGGRAEAPWWVLDGAGEWMAESGRWRDLADAAREAGFEWCWSMRLTTPAGEVVGTMTGFGGGPECEPPEREVVEEGARLAAMAIEQAHMVEELLYQARHDAVTGFWNRRYFEKQFQQWQGEREASEEAMLALADLDGFQRVREMLGGEMGDRLVEAASARLRQMLRGQDWAGRVGDDEFAMLLPGFSSRAEAAGLAERLQSALKRPYEIGGHEIYLSASMGFSAVEGWGQDYNELARKARAALGAARRLGAGRMAVFEAGMEMLSPERLEMERQLRGALSREEFQLYYQPQVTAGGLAMRGCEALLRWRQRDVGMVSPAVFIPLAEEAGLISEIGAWVLGEACRQARRWQELGEPVRVGVNVSGVQFADPEFAAMVERVLEQTGVDAALIELELTESVLLDNREVVIRNMHRLRAMGLEFALDDFGTGHSSLSYLQDLPLQRLKVDRSFLRELDNGGEARLLGNIVRLAHDLKLSVIVEGVEREDQLAKIEGLGCEEVQGFLVARPMGAEDLERWREAARAVKDI